MPYVRDMPICNNRYGRTYLVEIDGVLVPRCVITCGYREVEPQECITCKGFRDGFRYARIGFKVTEMGR